MSRFYYFVKRAMDLTLAVIFLIFIGSWLCVLIFFIYLIFYELPVFYIQERIGKNGAYFRMFKFKSLLSDTTKTLHERRFWFGDLLRRTNLDEIPQCWNIIKGEMSFIGPRPLPIEYLHYLSVHQRERHLVLPGITGWAQVHGKNDINWEKKFELDLYYSKHASFYLDMTIVIKTILLIFSFKTDNSLSEEKLKG